MHVTRRNGQAAIRKLERRVQVIPNIYKFPYLQAKSFLFEIFAIYSCREIPTILICDVSFHKLKNP